MYCYDVYEIKPLQVLPAQTLYGVTQKVRKSFDNLPILNNECLYIYIPENKKYF